MTKAILLTITMIALAAVCGCSDDGPFGPAPQADQAKAEDVTGNNLSFPVLWAEGVGVPLRGTFGAEMFAGQSTVVDGVELFHQHDPLNEWQAASLDASAAPLELDWVDWGDNLESRPWPDKSKIRVEVVLFQDLATPLLGYEMGWISGLGIDEMWGTSTLTYDAPQATVYSHCARLTIQKLTVAPETAVVTWDPALGRWVGDVGDPFYNSAVFMEGSSPTEKYSAEINVKGRIIYGMLWDTRTHGDGAGVYRVTFSLDGLNAPVPVNAFFTAATQVMIPEEEEESADKAEPTGATAVIDAANNLTWLDVTLVAGSGGGRNRPSDAGGGNGGSGGGGGRGGGRD